MIDPLDYFPFAKELIYDRNNNEIKNRTAIGRSYYAVYLYATKEYIQYNNNDSEIESVISNHQAFIRRLKNDSKRTFQKLGNQLFDLKRDREKADYRINSSISRNNAIKSYFFAIKIKGTIDKAFRNS